VAKGIKQKHAT